MEAIKTTLITSSLGSGALAPSLAEHAGVKSDFRDLKGRGARRKFCNASNTPDRICTVRVGSLMPDLPLLFWPNPSGQPGVEQVITRPDLSATLHEL
jgi:hypothetical protein